MNESIHLLFDAHVHIYPCYKEELAIRSAWKNLEKLASKSPYPVASLGLALSERPDCHFFSSLVDTMGKGLPFHCTLLDDGKVIRLQDEAQPRALYIFPGRQYVSKEGLEILALGKDLGDLGRIPARMLSEKILEEGLHPCFPWSPGKWLGNRGALVQDALDNFHTQQILLGDILMRPWIFPRPKLFTEALSKGYRILGGSDPLPFPGEETNIGRMATLAVGNFREESAQHDFLRLLHYQPMIRLPEDGGILGFMEFVYRMGRNELVRRTSQQ